jgi:gliding motility-associated protein GldM
MAQGKLSPRQRMINLMYLIFIAMLALNISVEVLSAFGVMNEKLTKANVATTERNLAFMDGLAAKVSEQPAKYQPLMEKAEQVNSLSNNLDIYLESIKTEMTKTVRESDRNNFEVQDKSDYLDQLFFVGDKLKSGGREFLNKINEYHTGMTSILGDDYPEIKSALDDNFSTEKVTRIIDGKKIDWLNYNFEGVPLIASKTKLTQMQSDIKTTQNELLSNMLSGQLTTEVSMTNYKAIVVPDKTAFFSGENFKGRVVLGRFDNTLSFDKVIINGNEVDSNVSGQVALDFPAGNVGERELVGELQFKEGDSIISIPIESSYAVIPRPNAAVISADKMNVVYRGVVNPMTISIPGVGNVSANAPGLSPAGGGGRYNMNVTTVPGREVTINVSGKLPGGLTVSDSKTFRIKDIPRPTGTIRGEDGNGGAVRMQRQGLEISTVGAALIDFDFDLNLNVTGFSFKVAGQPTVKVSGNKLNSQAKNALKRAKRGGAVQIFDISARIAGNSSYKLPRITPVIIELTN